MNLTEALEKLKENGAKITHKYFLENEYLELKDNKLITEDGFEFKILNLNYLHDWFVYVEQK